MPTPKEEYAARLRQIANRFGSLEQDTIQRSITLLQDMRDRLQVELTSAENFEAFRLQELTGNVDTMVNEYETQLRTLTNGSLRDSARLGASAVVEPLQAAGVEAGFFQPTPSQLNTLLDFSADLIRDVGSQTRRAINTEIRLASLGERSTFEAMQRITQRLGLDAGPEVVRGVAARGETILRTEMGRVYSVSEFAQQQVTAQAVPELQKRWLATGDRWTRPAHLRAHGQTVPIDEPFMVGGVEMMHPLDPSAPARLTVNCRCKSSTVHPDIGVVGGPLDARVAKELERR